MHHNIHYLEFTAITAFHSLSQWSAPDPYRHSEISLFVALLKFCFSPKHFLCLLDLTYLSVALEILGKSAATSGTSMMYAYVAEVYPTVLRNTATGTFYGNF